MLCLFTVFKLLLLYLRTSPTGKGSYNYETICRVLLDWIAGLQSSLVGWIVIDNPKSKSDFGFGLSIQYLHFNPNPKAIIILIKKQNSWSVLLQQ
jgi:hypothetical protein